ncbi:MAG TPA: hypothetical protein VG847_04445 [Chitinophagaceae bacterium]|nr:hypothetical protein [Chitinophagaceae bacterium]
MRKIIPILILLHLIVYTVSGQSFTVSDLLKLSAIPSKNIDRFMSKKGFSLTGGKLENDIMETEFTLKPDIKKNYAGPKHIIDVSFGNNERTFILHTSSLNELLQGQQLLSSQQFFYDDKKNVLKDFPVLFQKGNVAIQTSSVIIDSLPEYAFTLTVKRLPEGIKYAEDLLRFDSHEFLASFFGEQNVKKDLYYFSQQELQKCSVLFGGTPYQVVFVWGDADNLNKLQYIIVPHVLPTVSAAKENPVTGNSEWQFRNGIYPGMDVKELLRLNEVDFDIYGKNSGLAYMVKPGESGKIDFKKTAVSLSCTACDDLKIFNQQEVSAVEVTRNDIPMYINDVILYPSEKASAN